VGVEYFTRTRRRSPPCPTGDAIEIVLVQLTNQPCVIMIRWPRAPSITTPLPFNAVAAEIMKVLAAVATAHHRAQS
jgi:hypothetical protein